MFPNGFFSGVVAAVATIGFFSIAGEALDTPVVYKDARSRNCVAVEDPNGFRPCTQKLPARYDVAYVAPHITYTDLLYRK